MKREYRVCPREHKCVWTEQSDDRYFCVLSVCPYTARTDSARVVSSVKAENAVERRTDDFMSRCGNE